ncbi:putative hydro-lyase [Undibacterium sp. TS12]|uniref:putative hydro-lyase n=1 Tax=Undibacterium sp. TS12 TaxID=2908202 RepID=UPI001F4CC88B|nr:putative hydro-lyase [Undibacterium sp. TS12]MCH8619806.1 putative hydro-lyase [Undibacterium sp. TS12]
MQHASLSASQVRALCRSGEFSGSTAGMAAGHVQANLMMVPREHAFDFLLFCQRNPKPCPLVEVMDAGQFEARCAPGSDIRNDIGAYRIYEHGQLVRKVAEIHTYWEQYQQEGLVSFLLGCSFSFESALIEAGIPLRHIQQQKNVAMYRTSIACTPAGRFSGNMVVSMRPVKSRDVAKAVEVSARFPRVHGAPVHIGNPMAIGIHDLSQPDYGDAVVLLDDELPVFWACGVTPQYVAELSKLPFCITHAPGKMFVTDLLTSDAAGN